MPRLTNLDVEFVSLVDRAAVRDPTNPTEPQRFLLFKREGGRQTPSGGTMTPEEKAALTKAESDRDEAIAKAEKLEKSIEELTAKVSDLEKAAKPADEPAKIDKADLPVAVREALEKAEAQAQAAEVRIAKAEEIAKAERDQRITREFVAQAEAFTSLPVDAADFGPVLKAVNEKLSKEEAEAIDTVLKAAEERIRSNDVILKEIGRSGDPAPAADGDLDTLTARKAQEIRKADPAVSQYDALRQAMRDPEVQRAWASQR